MPLLQANMELLVSELPDGRLCLADAFVLNTFDELFSRPRISDEVRPAAGASGGVSGRGSCTPAHMLHCPVTVRLLLSFRVSTNISRGVELRSCVRHTARSRCLAMTRLCLLNTRATKVNLHLNFPEPPPLLRQVPHAPRMFQLLPWEHTNTGDTLKRIDRKVTVRRQPAAQQCRPASANTLSLFSEMNCFF